MQELDSKNIFSSLYSYKGPLNDLSELEIDGIINELQHPAFVKKIEQNVYWPKWNSPWWHILFLFEIGEIARVDKKLLIQILTNADKQLLHIFPIKEEDVDREINGCTEVMCFCFLGCLIKVCTYCGIDAFKYIPWAEDWFENYQLPDGGYNCDENAYNGSKKSSMLSTAPMLEAMLSIKRNKPSFTKFDTNIKKGITYFLEHQTFLTSSGKVMKGCGWEKLKFPIFYEYDYLRGLELIVDYSLLMKQSIDSIKINKALLLLKEFVALNSFYPEIDWLKKEKTVGFEQNRISMFENLANVPEFMSVFSSNIPNKYLFNRIRKLADKLVETEKFNVVK